MAKPLGTVAAAALRTAGGREESRTKLNGAVRAACRRLGITDDDRKAIQYEVTGQRSMGDMTLAQIGQVLDRLNRGYKGPMGHRAHVGKIRALWWTLYWLGAVNDPNDKALDTFVARQTGKVKIQFLGHKEAFRVIEGLKAWAEREGVKWPDDARVAQLRPTVPTIDLPRLERHAVLEAIADKLRDLRIIGASYFTYCDQALNLGLNQWAWDNQQIDRAIRFLGKKLRNAIGKAAAG